jgi:TolB-like protein/Flp pilus assembly protein TadD
VLEGSVRRGGDRLRITAQLIDADDGGHLWAERYDRPVDDLFDIQDEITKEIVTALRVNLTDGEEARVWARGTNNIEAWQYAIRAIETLQKFTLSSYLEARELSEKATELDPDYAFAWAVLGCTYWFEGRLDYTGGSDDKFVYADELAQRAMALDDSVPWAIGVSAVAAAPMGRYDDGIAMARRGFELYPGNADIRGFLAFALMNAGKYREAEEHIRAAMSLNPFYPTWYRIILARTLLGLDKFDEAKTLFDEVLETAPANILAWLSLAYIYGQTGRAADAGKAIAEIHQLAPNLRVSHMPKFLLINDVIFTDRFMDGLRKAGLSEGGKTEDDPSTLPAKPSIAVLPFDNMSGDPEQEFFTDGLAEDIITALSKIERMRVIARNSTFAYKGKALDLRRIAEELDVRYVLEGSVRRGGGRLRITAQLIDSTNGSHLWAERYDRPVDDLFDIQDEITKEIVTSLRVQLTDGESARVWARGTNNVEAWQIAVRAFELFMRLDSSSHLEARVLAEKATELDPNYAFAWAVLGLTYWFDGRLGYSGDTEAKFARAAELAEHAMALDDGDPWCVGLASLVAAAQNRYDEGVAIARRGIELFPGNADVRGYLGLVLMHAGNYREAVEHTRAAMSLNPFYPNWYRATLARALTFLDEFDEALTVFGEILETEKTHFLSRLFRAYIYGKSDRGADARKEVSEVRKLVPNLCVSDLPSLMMTSDAVSLERFSDGVREAGLPE